MCRRLSPSVGALRNQLTASPVSTHELRFPKIIGTRSFTPGVDFERIVSLRQYQELGEAAVLGPVTDERVRAVCDSVKK